MTMDVSFKTKSFHFYEKVIDNEMMVLCVLFFLLPTVKPRCDVFSLFLRDFVGDNDQI